MENLERWKGKLSEADSGLWFALRDDLTEKLEARPKESDWSDDSSLFGGLLTTVGLVIASPQFTSVVRELAIAVLSEIEDYEEREGLVVTKRDLYLLLAMMAVEANDESGISIWFERATSEFGRTTGQALRVDLITGELEKTLSSVTSTCASAYEQLSLMESRKAASAPTPAFSDILRNLQGDLLALYVLCSVRLVRIGRWLRSGEDLHYVRIQSLQLAQNLVVMTEATLKTHLGRSDGTFNDLISDRNLDRPLRAAIQSYKATKPLNSVEALNGNLSSALESLSLTTDDHEWRAIAISIAHGLRNKFLHADVESLDFYSKPKDFERVLAALLLAVAAVSTL
ncbi:MAG: hypothetical protein HN712_28160 [Gemmatimonadetes bacterium]|jgi:hypothetical protein|nr:hypothetical protein [Gemmatimonadota bacterium]MBT6148102.1 hypothetical protein [Gemmatimonadota bacterium]MBT7864218.1 hypothetical protein [Gemmatimonadota bacterium]